MPPYKIVSSLHIFFSIFFLFVVNFVIHWNETAMDLHVLRLWESVDDPSNLGLLPSHGSQELILWYFF